MEFVVLFVLEAMAAFVCAAVGLNMMTLCRWRFSDMTKEELARYWRGVIIVVVGMLPLLLTMIFFLP